MNQYSKGLPSHSVLKMPLTEIAGEEEGLCSGSPLLKKQAIVSQTLHPKGPVAACELVEASFCLFQLEKLLLQQIIPSHGTRNTKS